MTRIRIAPVPDLNLRIESQIIAPKEAEVFEGKDWDWDGSNVRLIKPVGPKTLQTGLNWIHALYEREILRPIHIGELTQLSTDPDHDLPLHWQNNGGSG